jgi:signal transduction histidine kinase
MMKEDEILNNYLLKDSAIIYFCINSEGKITKANEFTKNLTGIELIGINIKEVIIDFGKSLNMSELAEKENNILLNIKTKTGLPSTYYFKFIKTDNSIIAIGEANNIEIELLRKNLLELNKELSNLTREVQKKNYDLKRLDEQKNYFLGVAAHDLRNPIGIIMGFADFLLQDLEGKLSENEEKILRTISSSSEFMLKMLNDLLDIAKIESGKLILTPEKVDLEILAKENVELNRMIAKKKNIQIQFYCLEKIPYITADTIKIEQVLNNLISNAIKYSLPGTTIKVSLFLSGENVTVSLADQGQGIPEDELINVFKPFGTTSTKSTGGEKSTGLGLAIVQKIVLGHRGKIWVESKVGVGSTFYFSLPLKTNNNIQS